MNLLNRGRLNIGLLKTAQPISIGNILQEKTKSIPNVCDGYSSTEHLDGLNKLCNILVGLPCEQAAYTHISKRKKGENESATDTSTDREREVEGTVDSFLENQPSGKFEPIPIISKAEKVSKTPSQIKVEVEKKKQKAEDAEIIQQELNKKPQKPAEKLLNKLLKKQNRKKLPSHIKKAIKDIREFEKKRDSQENTNNKIIDAIKSAYV